MRYFLCALFLIVSKFALSQKVLRSFDQTLLYEEFEAQGDVWKQRYNAVEILSIQDNIFLMRRLAPEGSSIYIPVSLPEIEKVEYTASIKFEDKKSSGGGLVICANPTDNSAVLLEINGKGKFRLKEIANNQSSGDLRWYKGKGFKKKSYNRWMLKMENGFVDVYLNDIFQRSYVLQQSKSGKVGMFVNAGVSMMIDFVKINVVTPEEEEKKEPEDMADVLLIFRNKIGQQQKEIEQLQQELAYCKATAGIDTSARRINKELLQKNTELSRRIQQLEMDIDTKNKRLAYLESMREDLEKSTNGDMILSLTELLAKEKKELNAVKSDNEMLKLEIFRLQKELETIKSKLSPSSE